MAFLRITGLVFLCGITLSCGNKTLTTKAQNKNSAAVLTEAKTLQLYREMMIANPPDSLKLDFLLNIFG